MDIIKHLNELRAKNESQTDALHSPKPKEWCDGKHSHLDWNERCHKRHLEEDDQEYFTALHNAFPALRQAVLERDRYKAAGEALAKAVEKMSGTKIDGGGHLELFVERKDARDALAAYRTAIDDSSK